MAHWWRWPGLCLGALGFFAACPPHALAGPWAEVGQSQLRSDIETLAAAGVIDDVTLQWPIGWGGVLSRLNEPGALAGQPGYVREAAKRVARQGEEETRPGTVEYGLDLDATNAPDVVRGFDALGRQDLQSQAIIAWTGHTTAARLAVGFETANRFDHQALVLDNSYVAQRIGNAAVYAGYLSHWWGPGWTSALSLSNNVRPFPQIGITRVDTSAFSTPLLSWLGPWQGEFVIGFLDGPRVQRNTLWDGFHVSFNPIKGLEIGLARTDELCGEGHPCKPLATYFDLRNDPGHPSRTNDEGNIDLKYTALVGAMPLSVYAQLMNEDSSPIVHSGTSHVFGITGFVPIQATRVRLTAEYTDSIATKNVFSFGEQILGFAYNDGKYPDGMRYRDRALGFSLDSDSRLATLQASWIGAHAVTYTLTYHRAQVSIAQDPGANFLSPAPVTIDIAEARLSFPFYRFQVDAAVRFQDDRLRPDRGATGAFEMKLRYRF